MSAIGLGESLGLPGTTLDLIDRYPKETEDFISNNSDKYDLYCEEYKRGRKTNTSKKEFLKLEHSLGNYLPDIVTGDDLIQKFYKAYPKLHSFLVSSGETAKTTLQSKTPDPFGRIRFFLEPEFDNGYSSIERAGTNSRIQGASSNMTKYAIALLKKYIEKNKLSDRLKFILPIHDELQVLVRDDFKEKGFRIVIDCMEKAGEFILGNKLQKAEGEINDYWCK